MLKVFSVTSKLVLTAIVSLVLLVTGLAFAPAALQELLNAAKVIVRWLPKQDELPLNESARFLYDLVVDEQTMFGLLLTLVARVVVEVVSELIVLAVDPQGNKKQKEKRGKAGTVAPLPPLDPDELPGMGPVLGRGNGKTGIAARDDDLAPRKDDGLF